MADPEHDDAAPALDDFSQKLADNGFAMADGFPLNHRLRGEALVAAGLAEDPAGHVTPDFIADTADRLDAERRDAAEREAEAEANTPSMGWTRDRLVEEAGRRGVAIPSNADKRAIVDALNPAPADDQEG